MIRGRSFQVKMVVLAWMFVSLSGCFQYPEGPVFTMMTKDERISGNWYITEVFDANGNDVTTQYAGRTLYVQADRDSKSLSYFKDGILYSFGTYDFADYGDELIVVYSLYEGSENKEVLQIFFTIRKLTEKKFYYIDNNGIEFHWQKT